MKFNCPHCNQSVEVDASLAGKTMDCPICGQSLLVPRSAPPPVHTALQPAASTSSSSTVRRKSKPLGCELFFWLLVLIAAGAFGYAMHRWRTSPNETFRRIVTSAQRFISPEATPAPEQEAEEETPEPKVAPTPRPDPVPWLAEHRDYWPKEVVLQKAEQFPAVSDGKTIGLVTAVPGSVVKVLEIAKGDVEVDYLGGHRRIPIVATDLPTRANVAMAQAEADARRAAQITASVRPSAQPAASETPETIREATPDEIRNGLGAMYTGAATTFRLFAPDAKTVSVVLYAEASGNEGRTIHPLRRKLNGLWDTTVKGHLIGKFYTYLLDVADTRRRREVLDPYAVNSVASSTRGRITPMTTPVGPGPKLESPTDAIIYEMQVRDFTIDPNSGVKKAGLYLGWTESGTHLSGEGEGDETSLRQEATARQAASPLPMESQIKTALDHLAELGVTHVELMPVQDFENDETSGAYNWGYITTDFFSPEGMFATNPDDNSRVRELKTLVSALHKHGIGVIMDVVYNHTSGRSPLMAIAPEYYYRRAPNGSLANGSGCGNEVKTEAPMARRLILDSLKYWVKEYGIDGFRFDLMALIDQETIREADRELRKIDPDIILFGEPWTGGQTPLTSKTDKAAIRQVPVGAFNDDFRNALKGQPDGNEPGWIQNGSKRDALKAAMLVSDWFASPGQSINYMTCHDNLVLWDKLVASMPNADGALRIETMKLGFLTLFTSQGVPFMLGGGEFARTKGGDNNSYESPDSVNEIDWALKKEHLDLFNYVRDVIALRKAHPMFRLRTKSQVQSRVHFVDPPNREVLMFTINGEGVPGETWRRICVILNSADENDAEVTLPSGTWSAALDEGGTVSSSQPSTQNQSQSGKLTVRHKSGIVLYQP